MSNLNIGIAGLGTAAKQVLPAFDKVDGVRLAAAADVRVDAREEFTAKHNLPAHVSVEELCKSDTLDAVWIETPNHLHAAHAISAAENGKHVICTKPLAATLVECDKMIAASRANNVRLLIGHSKLFDPPIRAIGEIARSGNLGKVIQIDSWLYNDWLRRPRLAEELEEKKGAGFILRQAPHLVDIANYIAASAAQSVRAMTGKWEPNIASEGNCAALINYESGANASMSLNGYGYFDSSELSWRIGSFGKTHESAKPANRPEGALSANEKYAQSRDTSAGEAMPFFGLHIVSFERGLIRQSPNGLLVYTDEGCEEMLLPPYQGRAAELIELRDALRENRDVFPNG
ncbi:MAG: Gfo/Idh/MocA family oxidoreductase, partial [Micropepsaceae bacterium]